MANLVKDVTSGTNELVNDITDGIGNVLTNVDQGLNTLDTNVKTGLANATQAVNTGLQTAQNAVTDAGENATEIMDNASNRAKNLAGEVVSAATNIAADLGLTGVDGASDADDTDVDAETGDEDVDVDVDVDDDDDDEDAEDAVDAEGDEEGSDEKPGQLAQSSASKVGALDADALKALSLEELQPSVSASANLEYESDEEEDDDSFKKLKAFQEKDFLLAAHPESVSRNFDEIASLSKVVRNAKNQIIDPLHRMDPYLTKFEKARVLGVRTLQLQAGSQPFVKLPKPIMDSKLIAQMELEQKVLPFIIQRPDPNGGFEYWEVRDLEIIC